MKKLIGIPFVALMALATTSLAHAEDLYFDLSNETSVALMELYMSPSNVGEWEEDILGANMLPAGNIVNLTIADGRSDCIYDIMGVFADGVAVEDYGVDLCELGAYAFYEEPLADTEDLYFDLSNDTSVVLTELYMSPSNVGEWEEDILGQDVLPAGYTVNLTIADGRSDCIYDIMGVFADGVAVEDYGVDLCDLGAYAFYEE